MNIDPRPCQIKIYPVAAVGEGSGDMEIPDDNESGDGNPQEGRFDSEGDSVFGKLLTFSLFIWFLLLNHRWKLLDVF